MGLHAPRTLLYFSVSGLDLLGKLDELDREQTIECRGWQFAVGFLTGNPLGF